MPRAQSSSLSLADHADVYSGWLPAALQDAIDGKAYAGAPSRTRSRDICKIASTVVTPDGAAEAVSGKLDSLPGCMPVYPASASTCAGSPTARVLGGQALATPFGPSATSAPTPGLAVKAASPVLPANGARDSTFTQTDSRSRRVAHVQPSAGSVWRRWSSSGHQSSAARSADRLARSRVDGRAFVFGRELRICAPVRLSRIRRG